MVPPGQYTLTGNVYSGGPEAYGTGTVTVTADVSGATFTMSPPAYVAGRMSVAESESQVNVQDVAVLLRRHTDSNVYVARSDATGKFVFDKPIRPGHFAIEVEARSLAENCFVQKVKLGGQEISADDVEISASAQVEIVLSNKAGKITGSVSDEEASTIYPQGWKSPKPYIRIVPQPG